jgi:hypothetical protein
MNPALEQKNKAKTVQDWLNHPAWEDIIYPELEDEIKALNSKLIDSNDDDETKNLKYELRASKKFLDKLIGYSAIK